MMRIIVLHGMKNTGKSATLNLLYGILVPALPALPLATSHGNRVVLGNPVQNDFSETLTYNSELLEFFTMGDYPKKLEVAIRDAANRNCKIFVCACSSLSTGLIAIMQQHRTGFISKTVSVKPNQQVIFNTADAQTILNLL